MLSGDDLLKGIRALLIYFKFSCSTYRILRFALFWDVVQCRVVNLYLHFGTTYQSHRYS